MSAFTPLGSLLSLAAARWGQRIAVEESSGATVTYAELNALADAVATALRRAGVQRGDRIGMCLPKTIDAVGVIFGALKAGAAYVPVDPGGPVSRAAYILADCAVRYAFVDESVAVGLGRELERLEHASPLVSLRAGADGALRGALAALPTGTDAAAPAAAVREDDLAYILYTSGSTGAPKGVMLSHGNAFSFVDWCGTLLAPGPEDCFSAHAPFHFDLSILDLFVSLGHGARLVLVDAEQGKDPLALAELIAGRGITVWYSAPSILSLLVRFGRLERQDRSRLRFVLFAGEVFPVKYLRELRELVPHARFVNLYGPTETNVCTYHEIPEVIPSDRTEPYPIGQACPQFTTRVVEGDADVPPGSEGELVVSGPGTMIGYWNQPAATARAFLVDDAGRRWYRTGDVVVEEEGVYLFRGRRDRMVKRRGYRIELGEIEAGLYRHPDVVEAAVVAVPDDESGVRIRAFLHCRGASPSTLALRRFAAGVLPRSMVPDEFVVRAALPKTSTDKIDYQRLTAGR